MSALRATLPCLALSVALPGLTGCKGPRAKLEQLVPDGATVVVSVDGEAIVKSAVYETIVAKTKSIAERDEKVTKATARFKDECSLDLEAIEAYVIGFDALSQGVMAAVRMPKIGSKDALECIGKVAPDLGMPADMWKVSEEDGRPKLELAGGEAIGWGIDDDTMVVSSKGWVSAVQQRIKGEGKPAVDNYLKEAVALADTGATMWFAGQMPPIVRPFIDDSPVAGVDRVGGSLDFKDDLEVKLAAAFSEEARATEAKDELTKLVESGKAIAIEQGVPQKVFDSFELEADGKVLRAKVTVPIVEILDATTQSFEKYISRSKTSEARVQLAKMFDGASAYFNEEHVARGQAAIIGEDGAIVGPAPHACPNDGRPQGDSGAVPPLSVDCSKGPGGRCVAVTGAASNPGEYDMTLWTGSDVWNGLNFQVEQGHYFHYRFAWKNDASGFGSCQFTAQAFGDLDGDGVFSTFERAGAADQHGVNAAAGLYIDQETE